MSRTEIANGLTSAAVDKRTRDWGGRLAQLRTMQDDVTSQMQQLSVGKLRSAEEMAQVLLPLAKAMAALVEETRDTLASVSSMIQEMQEAAVASARASTDEARRATTEARRATAELQKAMARTAEEIARMERVAASMQASAQRSLWAPALVGSLLPTAAVLAVGVILYLK